MMNQLFQDLQDNLVLLIQHKANKQILIIVLIEQLIEENEENEEKALFNKKICKRFLIAAAVSLVVFGVLKIIFPFS